VAGLGNITIKIGAETADAVRGIGQVNKALGDQMTAGQKASSALKKAAIPAAAAFGVATTAIVGWTKAAAGDADAQDALARSLKQTTGATDAQVKASEDYISKLSAATGVTDDEMRPALEKMAAATHDAKTGQKQLALAVDIAQASHTDLATATKAVTAADKGRLGALAKLVPGIDNATIKSKDSAAALDEAAKLTAGAATDAAKTYGGQMKVMSNQIGEAEESIGAAFLPVLDKLLPVLKKVTDFVSENTTAFTFLIAAVAGVAGVILAANAALKVYQAATILVKTATTVWTGVQWLLNAALNANPIGLIVLAIVGAAGLVVAIKLAYDHCETFRVIVGKLWDAIKTGITLYLKPLALTFDAVRWAFEKVKAAIESPFALTALGAIADTLKPLLDVLTSILRTLRRIAEVTFDALIGGIKTLLGWLEKIHIPKVPDWVPGIGGRIAMPAIAGPSARLGVGPVAAGSSGGLTINVFGALDAEGTARQVQRLLRAHERRQGRLA